MSALVFLFFNLQPEWNGEIKTNQNETFLVNHSLMNRF